MNVSSTVSDRLQVQSHRIDTVSESIQKFEENAANNTKLLHDLLVNMENLGDTVKQMKSDFMNWEQEELPVETEEERLQKELDASLMQEVSLSVPHVDEKDDPSVVPPISMPVSVPITIGNKPSTSSLPENLDQQMKAKFDQLKQPAVDKTVKNPEKEDLSTQFKFDTPASMTLPYPGLDGHQRRITPIPISVPSPPPEKTSPSIRPPPPSKTGWY